MYDEGRKFSACIFCGSTGPLTAEHVFGKRLAKEFRSPKNWSVVDPSGARIIGSSSILDICPKGVCKRCNTESLSRTMAPAYQALRPLILGKKTTIQRAKIRALSLYWERAAAIIDVCTSNHGIVADGEHEETKWYRRSGRWRCHPPCITAEDRRSWEAEVREFGPNASALQGVRVFIGHHSGVLGLNPEFNIAFTRDQHSTYTKLVTLTIRHLSVCMLIQAQPSSTTKNIALSFEELRHGSGSIAWPPQQEVTYFDIFDLYNPDQETIAKRAIMNNDSLRRLVESHSRTVGQFECPRDLPNHPEYRTLFARPENHP